jgi:hypothetical protein
VLSNWIRRPPFLGFACFAAEKGIELALEELDILAGQSRTTEFLAKNSSGGAGART